MRDGGPRCGDLGPRCGDGGPRCGGWRSTLWGMEVHVRAGGPRCGDRVLSCGRWRAMLSGMEVHVVGMEVHVVGDGGPRCAGWRSTFWGMEVHIVGLTFRCGGWNHMLSVHGKGMMKVCSLDPSHMTKMAVTPIYVKIPSKIFSRTCVPISTKLSM